MTKTELKSELPEALLTLSVEGQAARISIANSKMDHVLADLEEALRGVLHSPALALDCKSAATDTPELPPALEYLRILGNNTHAQLVRLHGVASRLAISGEPSQSDRLTPPLNEANEAKTLEAQANGLAGLAKFQLTQLTGLAAIISPILLPDTSGDEAAKDDPRPPQSVAAEVLMDAAAQFERNVAYAGHLISLINMR
ncbi:hypothetical protein [Stutzerimonas nitrititolerans]|uniref:hypothetical protein n=1 Tax=Stutzerimonas nitrititolerans TaxID=2482751 RepID=UPI0028B0E044|nr:hypothetical protein [Stutzerimonas nitrititolerans]